MDVKAQPDVWSCLGAGALHRPRSRPRSERRTAPRPIPCTLLERRHDSNDRGPVRPEEAFGAVVEGLDLADLTAAEVTRRLRGCSSATAYSSSGTNP